MSICEDVLDPHNKQKSQLYFCMYSSSVRLSFTVYSHAVFAVMHHDTKADCLYEKTYFALNQILILIQIQILIMFMGNKAIDGGAVRVNGMPSVVLLYCSFPLTGLADAWPTDITCHRCLKISIHADW